jgi:hypothetical protein
MTKIEKECIHLLKNAYSHIVRSIIYHKKQNLKIQYACIAYFALVNKKIVYEIQIRTHIQGFFYRPKVADIFKIFFLSPGSDKIWY